jgi:hypothetical protein
MTRTTRWRSPLRRERGGGCEGRRRWPLGEEERDVVDINQERRRPVTAGSGRDEMRRVRHIQQMRRVTCAAAAPCRRTCKGVARRWG